MTKAERAAYGMGWHVGRCGAPTRLCPYTRGSSLWRCWQEGHANGAAAKAKTAQQGGPTAF